MNETFAMPTPVEGNASEAAYWRLDPPAVRTIPRSVRVTPGRALPKQAIVTILPRNHG